MKYFCKNNHGKLIQCILRPIRDSIIKPIFYLLPILSDFSRGLTIVGVSLFCLWREGLTFLILISVGLGIWGLYLDFGTFLVIGSLFFVKDGWTCLYALGSLDGFLAYRIILLENLFPIF